MSRHTTHKGLTIDMDSMRRDNAKTVALGNMGTNAAGDRIKNGVITKTADELARERHRVPTAILRTGLKGPIPEGIEEIKPEIQPRPIAVEKELPNGDIIIEKEVKKK